MVAIPCVLGREAVGEKQITTGRAAVSNIISKTTRPNYIFFKSELLLVCVWPIWRVHPKTLTGQCGWNYRNIEDFWWRNEWVIQVWRILETYLLRYLPFVSGVFISNQFAGRIQKGRAQFVSLIMFWIYWTPVVIWFSQAVVGCDHCWVRSVWGGTWCLKK